MAREHPFAVPVAFGVAAALAVLLAPALSVEPSLGILLAQVADECVPGGRLPIVAEVAAGVDEPLGGHSVRVPVSARLLDARGSVLAQTVLVLGADGRSRGNLRVPETARGEHRVRLEAVRGDASVRIEARVHVRPPTRPASRVRRSGIVGVSPVHERLLVRAEGGACAPEIPCRVYVAEPEDLRGLHYEAAEGTRILTADRPEPGLVRLGIETHGFGGRVRASPVQASESPSGPAGLSDREDAGAAAESVELGVPVALGGARFTVDRSFSTDGRVVLALSRSVPPAFVDVDRYVEGAWSETQGFDARALERGVRWPTELAVGVHRFEARDSGGSPLGSAIVVVHEPGGEQDAWARLSAFVDAEDPWRAAHLSFVPEASVRDEHARALVAQTLLLGSLARPPVLDSRTQRAMGSVRRVPVAREWLAFAVVSLGLAAAAYVVKRGREPPAGSQADALEALVLAGPGRRLEPLIAATTIVVFAVLALLVLLR